VLENEDSLFVANSMQALKSLRMEAWSSGEDRVMKKRSFFMTRTSIVFAAERTAMAFGVSQRDRIF
jgi:hypothetical protein